MELRQRKFSAEYLLSHHTLHKTLLNVRSIPKSAREIGVLNVFM
jgi:hypothetical protein